MFGVTTIRTCQVRLFRTIAHKMMMMHSCEFASSTEGAYLQNGTDERPFNV